MDDCIKRSKNCFFTILQYSDTPLLHALYGVVLEDKGALSFA